MRAQDAVLLVAHGTVRELADLPEFLARIRGGRPVSAEFVKELRGRYEAIGGSPLLEVTEAQAALLGRELGVPVFVGMRLWHPGIERALGEAVARGVERLAVIALAPFSVHVYWRATEQAASSVREKGERVPELVCAPPWGTHPAFVAAHAALVRQHVPAAVPLILTAHSLPLVALRAGDPYEAQVRASATAIGEALGRPVELAFQSQGEGGGEWLGPDLRSLLERKRGEGAARVAVAPFGFLGEHVETLYDLDIEARRWSTELGLELVRVPAIGTAPGLIEALAELSRGALGT